ncbi:MAG: aminoglycoside phosphotransferase family protein [bacterium]|nr:aminoglycoside phosphotransferase family protein [bacterium]
MSAPGSLLPTIDSESQMDRLLLDPEVWRPAVTAVCKREGLDPNRAIHIRKGSNVVWSIEDRLILKMFVPLWLEDAQIEQAALEAASGHGIPVPEIRRTGSLEGWPYLLLTKLPGRSFEEVLPELSEADGVRICHALGAAMRRLHAIDVTNVPLPRPDWADFLKARRAAFRHDHTHARVPASLLDDAEAWLDRVGSPCAQAFEPVFLCADFTFEHVMCDIVDGQLELTGLIDLADAMIGHAPYEFAAPAVFLTGRRPGWQRALLEGYGRPDLIGNERFREQVISYILLHRYGRTAGTLQVLPAPRPEALAGMADALWSCGT